MRKHLILFSTLIMALFFISCKRIEKSPTVRSEVIDGIEHIYNTLEPAKGKISLEVAEVLSIDPLDIDTEEPPLFQMAKKDKTGNLYLADSRNVRVFKFDLSGKLITQFLRKGQGPGEFPRFGDIQIAHNFIWVIGNWPMKIAKYTPDGQYVNEWLFRTFRNFYLRTQVVDEDRFLTVSYREGTQGQDRRRVSALINSKEEFLTVHYEDKDAGIFRIRTEQQEGPAIASTSPLVAADIHHAYDRNSGFIYVCNNREYKIHSKNTDGATRLVIHKDHKNIPLDEEQKESILQMIAPRLPVEAKQQGKDQLPYTLNAIMGIEILPKGHLAVQRTTGLESIEIDVFDRDGSCIYTILPSAKIPDLRDVIFFDDSIGVIAEFEEKNVFIEYRVNNMKGIFD
ncbi:MAG: 6-bladed beta-propeller [Candidatus Aminicenantes bacterium]